MRTAVDASHDWRTTTIAVVFDIGARDESNRQHGVIHLLEHVLLIQSPPDRLSLIDSVYSKGGECNGSTGHEETVFWIRVQHVHAEQVIKQMMKALLAANFDHEQVDRERFIISEELLGTRHDNYETGFRKFTRLLMGTHPFTRAIGGTATSVRHLDSALVEQMYVDQFLNSPMGVAIVTGADMAAPIEDALQEACQDFSSSNTLREKTRTAPVPSRERRVQIASKRTRGFLFVGGLGFSRHHRLWAASEVLAELLSGAPQSDLYLALRVEARLAYDFSAYHDTYTDSGLWVCAVETSRDNASHIAGIVEGLVQRTARQAFDIPRIEAAKNRLFAAFDFSLDHPIERAESLALSLVRNDGPEWIDPVLIDADAVAGVTPEDVADAAQEVLTSWTVCFS